MIKNIAIDHSAYRMRAPIVRRPREATATETSAANSAMDQK